MTRNATLGCFNRKDVRQVNLLLDAMKSIAPIIVFEQLVPVASGGTTSSDTTSLMRTRFVILDAHGTDAMSSIVMHALVEPDEDEATATDSSSRLSRVGAVTGSAPRQTQQSHAQQQQRHAPSAGGKFPLYQRFPRMVELLRTFIETQGHVGAHERRRATVGLATGVSLEQCRQHLLTEMPELKDAGVKLTRSTIHYMLLPPRTSTVAARNYHGVVDSRIPTRDNSLSKSHPDSHFCSAQLGAWKDLAVHTDEIDFFSCDDKVNF